MATRSANGRSTIIQRPDGRWHGWVSMGALPSGRPDRRHVSATTQSAVAAKVKGLERQRDTGAVTSSGRVTVGAYLAEWIARKERMGSVRPLTLSGYRTDERHIAAAIGRVRLDRLAPANVEHLWSSMLDQGLSVAHCRRTLNAALNDAVKRGVMARNPVRVAETPHQREAEIEPYTIEEMGSLLRAAQGSRNSTRWTVAMALGLRQGEVLGLCWDDVALRAGEGSEATVTVRRQLQRLSWQHGCSDPERCVNRAGTHAKRAADCPQRWGGGLRVSSRSQPPVAARSPSRPRSPPSFVSTRRRRRSSGWPARYGSRARAVGGCSPIQWGDRPTHAPTLVTSRLSARRPAFRPRGFTTCAIQRRP